MNDVAVPSRVLSYAIGGREPDQPPAEQAAPQTPRASVARRGFEVLVRYCALGTSMLHRWRAAMAFATPNSRGRCLTRAASSALPWRSSGSTQRAILPQSFSAVALRWLPARVTHGMSGRAFHTARLEPPRVVVAGLLGFARARSMHRHLTWGAAHCSRACLAGPSGPA